MKFDWQAEHILHKSYDDHSEICVKEQSMVRSLYFGTDKKQSSIFTPDPGVLVLQYSQAMMSSLVFNSSPMRILVLGLGGAGIVHFLLKSLPECEIVAVEIRKRVIEIAEHFFYLPIENSRLTVVNEDAKKFVEEAPETYDIIFVDAFDRWGPAEINSDKRFLSNAKALLTSNGIICFNLWNRKEDVYQACYKHVAECFNWQVLELKFGRQNSNVILFAFNSSSDVSQVPHLQSRAVAMKEKYGVEFPDFFKKIKKQNFTLIKNIKKKLFT